MLFQHGERIEELLFIRIEVVETVQVKHIVSADVCSLRLMQFFTLCHLVKVHSIGDLATDLCLHRIPCHTTNVGKCEAKGVFVAVAERTAVQDDSDDLIDHSIGELLEFWGVIVVQREGVEPMWHLMEEIVALQGGERSEIDIGTIQLQFCHLMHLLVHLLVSHPLWILSVLDKCIWIDVLLFRRVLFHQPLHEHRHNVVAHT